MVPRLSVGLLFVEAALPNSFVRGVLPAFWVPVSSSLMNECMNRRDLKVVVFDRLQATDSSGMIDRSIAESTL